LGELRLLTVMLAGLAAAPRRDGWGLLLPYAAIAG